MRANLGRRNVATVQALVCAGSRIVFTGGLLAHDHEGHMVGVGDPEAQIRFVFRELDRIVREAGGTIGDVTKLIVQLVALADYPIFQKVRAEYFAAAEFPPTCSLVQVVSLVRPEARIRLEAIAVLDRTAETR